MKFTKPLVALTLLSATLLSACSSLSPMVNTEPQAEDVAPEVLTPLQVKVKSLQGQPNLYQDKKSQFSANNQTLSQFQKGLSLKQQGKFSEAKAVFSRLSEQHPELSGIWVQLALVNKQLSKKSTQQTLKDMARYLNNAVAANPYNYVAHNELGQVLRQQGQFQNALKHYDLALKSWPAFSQAYLSRGILYDLYLGEKSLALNDYELYQALSNDESRQLKGWIIDLQRQIKRAQAAS